MLETAFVLLVLLNIGILLVIVTHPTDEEEGPKRYNIVDMVEGEVLQGPLSLKKARRAQRKWNTLCVWHDGPPTTIEVAR